MKRYAIVIENVATNRQAAWSTWKSTPRDDAWEAAKAAALFFENVYRFSSSVDPNNEEL